MKFLSKLGKILLKGTEIIPYVGPLIKTYTPDHIDAKIDIATDKMQELLSVVISAEAFGQALKLSGEDKLKGASVAAAQVILTSSILADREIDDPVLFQQGVIKMTSGMADVANSLKDDVKTVNKA